MTIFGNPLDFMSSGLTACQELMCAQVGFSPLHLAGFLILVFAVGVAVFKDRRASITVNLLLLALVAAYEVTIHGDPDFQGRLIRLFAFIPSRYTLGGAAAGSGLYPPTGGLPAALWSPFSYMLLHGNGSHLFGNCVALFVFGRSVAWRLGAWRFLGFAALAGAAGALFYMLCNWGDATPLIGASAGIFGVMAATFRFVPRTNDRLEALFWPDETVRHVPLIRPLDLVRERRSLVYIAVCFLVYPLGLLALVYGMSGNVAVTAHLGGFAFGLFAVGWFDRAKPELPREQLGSKRHEPVPMRLLRIASIIVVAIGILLGLGYYVMPFMP
jgi:membrane associated rhomboid family serine protease